MPASLLPITTALTSIVVIWLIILSWRVIAGRRSTGATLGDGGNESLERRIRAQANLTEYAPLFVLLIAILELQNQNPTALMALSVMFVLGRLGHGYALSFSTKNILGRVGGMILTLTALLLAATYGFVSLF